MCLLTTAGGDCAALGAAGRVFIYCERILYKVFSFGEGGAGGEGRQEGRIREKLRKAEQTQGW